MLKCNELDYKTEDPTRRAGDKRRIAEEDYFSAILDSPQRLRDELFPFRIRTACLCGFS